jgi:uncharacterized coiled-coil protein SlyX
MNSQSEQLAQVAGQREALLKQISTMESHMSLGAKVVSALRATLAERTQERTLLREALAERTDKMTALEEDINSNAIGQMQAQVCAINFIQNMNRARSMMI